MVTQKEYVNAITQAIGDQRAANQSSTSTAARESSEQGGSATESGRSGSSSEVSGAESTQGTASTEDSRLNEKHPDYVPPWEELPGQAAALGSLTQTLEHLNNTRKGKTFRALSDTETKILNGILGQLAPALKGAKEVVKHIVVQEGSSAGGTFYSDVGTIGLNPEVFTTPAKGVDTSVEDRVQRTLTHELYHAKDHANRNEHGQYWSETQSRYYVGGVVYEQVKQAIAGDVSASAWFGYIFRTDNPLAAHRQARELYAQVHTLKHTKAEVFNGLFGQNKNQETTESVGRDGTGRQGSGTGNSLGQAQASDQGTDSQGDSGRGGSRVSGAVTESTEQPKSGLIAFTSARASKWLNWGCDVNQTPFTQRYTDEPYARTELIKPTYVGFFFTSL